MSSKTYELCPFCEYEVELKSVKYYRQKCSNCDNLILPCSLCNFEKINCDKCLNIEISSNL